MMALISVKQVFDELSELFLKKWRESELEFTKYFKKQWLGAHRNWFEGAADYTPATNNGLEGFNGVIKELYTFRNRLPFAEFIDVISDIAKKISTEFDTGERQFLKEPKIERKLWAKSFEWAQNKEIHRLSYGDNRYFVQSSKNMAVHDFSIDYCRKLLYTNWKSFDEYYDKGFAKFYAVKMSTTNWIRKSKCTCPYFCKRYVCKHVVGMA